MPCNSTFSLLSLSLKNLLMKKILIVLFSGILPLVLSAQKSDIETIFQKGKTHYSAYVSTSLVFSELIDAVHLNSAFSIGMIVNRNIFIGGYKTNTNSFLYGKVLDNDLKDPLIHQFYHRGIDLDYVINPLSMVNFGGGVRLGTGRLILNPDPDFDRHYDIEDCFLSMLPSVHAAINLFDWMKMKINVSYRLIYGVDTEIKPWGSVSTIYYSSKDFSRPEFSISLVIGGLNDKSFQKK